MVVGVLYLINYNIVCHTKQPIRHRIGYWMIVLSYVPMTSNYPTINSRRKHVTT
jgi:hypothetical protein